MPGIALSLRTQWKQRDKAWPPSSLQTRGHALGVVPKILQSPGQGLGWEWVEIQVPLHLAFSRPPAGSLKEPPDLLT